MVIATATAMPAQLLQKCFFVYTIAIQNYNVRRYRVYSLYAIVRFDGVIVAIVWETGLILVPCF